MNSSFPYYLLGLLARLFYAIACIIVVLAVMFQGWPFLLSAISLAISGLVLAALEDIGNRLRSVEVNQMLLLEEMRQQHQP